MKLYFAGSTSETDVTQLVNGGVTRLLFSYAYHKPVRKLLALTSNYDVLLDSGAFSAFTLGLKLNLDEYCNYLRELNVKLYFNLDVIGDWNQTDRNLREMELRGFNPIPVITTGTPIKEMERILESYKYVALGGLVGQKNKSRQAVIDSAWRIIKKYFPIKVHGLGVTDKQLILRYPWYSVDSSSHLSSRRFGNPVDRTTHPELVKFRLKARHWSYRQNFDIEYMLRLEKEVTDIWKLRGIVWED